MNNIFEIENLECAYSQKSGIVLNIDRLYIPESQMIFVVGPSGIGKSTILEILGFMNNTIVSVKKFAYKGRDVSKAWKWSDDELSEFRNQEFSFIFQDNNLMPNFSALENVMITAMFQGMDKVKAEKEAKEIMNLLDLPSLQDRSIRQYSGGQRQRLSFARAILPRFSVLFGDEPTGNLDEGSAENVMKILQDKVHERKVTAVIVSHDMRLATKYADMIIQIQKKEKENSLDYYGYIGQESIYIKECNEWKQDKNSFSQEEFLSKLERDLQK
jgi:ABC-type lipoprotein export system ATPase subunit